MSNIRNINKFIEDNMLNEDEANQLWMNNRPSNMNMELFQQCRYMTQETYAVIMNMQFNPDYYLSR